MKKRTLIFAAAALAVTGLFFVRANSFLTFLLALFFLYLFLPPIFSIGEAMSLEASDNAPRPFYSFVRAFGSGAYALTGVTVALLGLSDIDMIFKLMIGVLALCMFSILLMPKMRSHRQKYSGENYGLSALFSDKRLMVLITFIFFMNVAHGYACNFFPLYLVNTLGASDLVYTLYIFFAVIIEVPLIPLIKKALTRFGILKLYTVACAAVVVRCVLLGFVSSIPALFFLSVLQALASISLLYGSATLINVTMPPALKASGQGLISAVIMGLSPLVGNLAGGALSDLSGSMPFSFLLCGLFALAVLIVYFFVFRRIRSDEAQYGNLYQSF